MAHTEFGFQVVKKFLEEVAPYGHPDFQPKMIGRGINVMVSPLPRNKRAKNPRQDEAGRATDRDGMPAPEDEDDEDEAESLPAPVKAKRGPLPPDADGLVNGANVKG
jgi:translation initiation factor IF-3